MSKLTTEEQLATEALRKQLEEGPVKKEGFFNWLENMGLKLDPKSRARVAFAAHAKRDGEDTYVNNDVVRTGVKLNRKKAAPEPPVPPETSAALTIVYEGEVKYARVGMRDGTSHNHLGKIIKVVIYMSGPAVIAAALIVCYYFI